MGWGEDGPLANGYHKEGLGESLPLEGNLEEGHMARVLVAGGAGFMGSHVVDGLVAKGHEELVVDDLSTGTPSNLSRMSSLLT